ncbi:hypothetical protein TRFO_17903 [Tritrichomonas foetus]|uniref:Uncharacterized protein n=1 Tax=Tritrichomonas foetus TaxID=1144522 RepID=A0A1J4KLY0_9EUKA|nr:hypothetical protein TRFO_17903 [Tritrichomonas foetus]|eukprot:OHT12319.1 hypothetical protein TRFO_17903 [Tritrichomonas foetus]
MKSGSGSFSQFLKDSSSLDLFIANIARDSSRDANSIIQMGINIASIKKDKYEQEIINDLENYPSPNSSFYLSIPTFAALAKSDPTNVLEHVSLFFPRFLESSNPKDIFSFFPKVPVAEDSLIFFLISYFSDKIFTILASMCIKHYESIPDIIVEMLLNRCFNHIPPIPEVNTLQFKVYKMMIQTHHKIISYLCRNGYFKSFANHFNHNFQAHLNSPINLILYLKTIEGCRFNESNFPLIKDTVAQFVRLFDLHSKRIEVIDALCYSLCAFLPQMKSFLDHSFIYRIEKKAELYIKRLKGSVSQLYGVFHYLQYSQKQQKLFERFFIKRLRKPEKVKFALNYILYLFQPKEDSQFNLNSEIIAMIPEIASHLLEAPKKNNEELFSQVFIYLAFIDFQKFVFQWLPQLLKGDEHHKLIAFLTIEKVLNPLYKTQSTLRKIDNFQQYLSNILKQVSQFTEAFFKKDMVTSDFALHFVSLNEIMTKYFIPEEIDHLNNLKIPTNVLYFLLSLKNINPIESPPLNFIDELKKSERICEDSLNLWMKELDALHSGNGDIYERLHLTFGKYGKSRNDAFLFPFLQILPILFHYSTNPNEYTQPLLLLIICNDARIASAAAIVFELLLVGFPSFSAFFINELVQMVRINKKLSAPQIHRIILVYLHCIKISKNFINNSLDLIQEFSDFIALVGLCSQYPETRLLSFSIMKKASSLQNNNEDTLKYFIISHSNVIVKKSFCSILSEFSTHKLSRNQLPVLSFRQAVSSSFILIWRFYFSTLIEELLKGPQGMTSLLISVRESFIHQIQNISDFIQNDIYFNSIKLSFLFESSTPLPQIAPLQRKQWSVQATEIEQMINSYILAYSNIDCNIDSIPDNRSDTSNSKKSDRHNDKHVDKHINKYIEEKIEPKKYFDSEVIRLLSQVFSKTHFDSLPSMINKLFEIENSQALLMILSTTLRHISSKSLYNENVHQMISEQQVTYIFSLFDRILPTISSDVDDDNSIIIYNFLVYRGMYYKYLHHHHLIQPLGPIPRCAISLSLNNEIISPILSRPTLFEILFQWSLNDNKLANSARFALSYLVSLGPIFADDKSFSPTFISNCTKIAKKRPQFLKHFISSHISLLFSRFIRNTLIFPLEEAVLYLEAISAQFIPPGKKGSLATAYLVFISDQKLNDGDPQLAHIIYSEVGTVILVGLIFLMHIDIKVRQSSIRLLSQLLPIIYLLHNNSNNMNDISENNKLTSLMHALKKIISALSSDSESLRIQNAIELSTSLSTLFGFATEQVISRSFSALPKTLQARKYCTRSQIVQILAPWMSNVAFDLKTRLIIQNASRFFLYFSPYSFVEELCNCMAVIDEEAVITLVLWSSLTINNNVGAGESNISFLVLTIIDIASLKKVLRPLATKIMTFLFRVSNKTINFVVPLVSFSNWYFHYVQVGRFEEISDMGDYLQNGIGKRVQVDFTKIRQKCNESVEFALDVLVQFALEDTIPFSHESLSIILAYCLSHINNKRAFKLIHTLSGVLKSSFDSGVPAVLRDVCELLDRINSIPFETLRFVIESDDPPLRSLQSRIVPIAPILALLIQVFEYLPSGDDSVFSREFLCWGLSCGDLAVAANSLNLYALKFTTTDTIIISHIIESTCSVLRCWIFSPESEIATRHTADYIISSLRTMLMIASSLKEQNVLQHYSIFYWISICILSIRGSIFPFILHDALKLITYLIKNRVYEKESMFSGDFEDFEPFLLPIIMNCRDIHILYIFLMQLVRIPREMLSKNGNYSLYMIAFAPLICFSLETSSSSALTEICTIVQFRSLLERLSDLYSGTHVATLLKQILDSHATFTVQEFSFNLIHALNSLTKTKVLEKAAYILSGLVQHGSTIKIDSLFDLGAALLSVLPTKEVVEGLSTLTCEATLNQLCEVTSSKIRLLQAISNFSQTANFLQIMENSRKFIIVQEQWGNVVRAIQEFVQKKLHQLFRDPDKVVKVRFDSIDTFPPIFPFEETFMQCECVNEVIAFCRRIQVNPQSNWAFSLYCAADISEIKAAENENPDLNFDIDFDREIQQSTLKVESELPSNICHVVNIESNLESNLLSDLISNLESNIESTLTSNSANANADNIIIKTNKIVTDESESTSNVEDIISMKMNVEKERSKEFYTPKNVVYTAGKGESLMSFVSLDAFVPPLDKVDSMLAMNISKTFNLVMPT